MDLEFRTPEFSHRQDLLGRNHHHRSSDGNPGEDRQDTAAVRDNSVDPLWRQNGGKVILATRGGVDTAQLRQSDGDADVEYGAEYQAVEQGGGSSLKQSNLDTCRDTCPTVADVEAESDHGEASQVFGHRTGIGRKGQLRTLDVDNVLCGGSEFTGTAAPASICNCSLIRVANVVIPGVHTAFHSLHRLLGLEDFHIVVRLHFAWNTLVNSSVCCRVRRRPPLQI